MAYRARHLAARHHPVLRAVAVSTALVLAVLAGTVYLAYRNLEGNITVSEGFDDILVDRPAEEPVAEGPDRPLNILVLGSDTRKGQTAVKGRADGLSDTTILLHLSADRTRAYGISIPRDLMVPRPECMAADGEGTVPAVDVAQWNEAFALGGEACTVAQFEQVSGLRVNHFVIVDFKGFTQMVDALGGVPVCLPQEVNDPIGDIYLPAGRYEVTGNQALDYVRVRHSIGTVETGDIGRMKRQQVFMAAMVNKAVSAGTLANPYRLYRFLDAATSSLTTDPGLRKLSKLAELGSQVRDIGLSKVQFFSVPFEAYEPDPNRLQLAQDADLLWRQLRRDVPLDKRFTSGAAKASDGEPGRGGGGGGGGGNGTGTPSPSPSESAEAAAAGLCA